MKSPYTVAQVRERLASALDEADRGLPVYIERRGVRYRLSLEPQAPRPVKRRGSRVEVVDPAVAEGAWTWEWTAEGLDFQAAPRRR